MSRLKKQQFHQIYQSLASANHLDEDPLALSSHQHQHQETYLQLMAQYDAQALADKTNADFLQKGQQITMDQFLNHKQQSRIYQQALEKLTDLDREKGLIQNSQPRPIPHNQQVFTSDHEVVSSLSNRKNRVPTFSNPPSCPPQISRRNQHQHQNQNKKSVINRNEKRCQSVLSDRDLAINRKQAFSEKYDENEKKSEKIYEKWMKRQNFPIEESKGKNLEKVEKKIESKNSIQQKRRTLKIKHEGKRSNSSNGQKKLKNAKTERKKSVNHSRIPSERSFVFQSNKKKTKEQIKKKKRTLSEIRVDKKKQVSPSAVKKIKNRIQLGNLVYEDSEHRTLSHEKCHLANTFETQRKMRRELINKVCRAKQSKVKGGKREGRS